MYECASQNDSMSPLKTEKRGNAGEIATA